MKKGIKRISLIGISLIYLLQKYCFAVNTIADGMLRQSRTMMKDAEPEVAESSNSLPIIIGIVIAIIVVVAVIVIAKKRKKEKNDKE